ncbi:MAG TPA: relaxase domain-containing protein [Solirubrobacteraceae bacterium]
MTTTTRGAGEAPGEWVGAGAGELGLEGRVSAGEFTALLEGRDPRAPESRLRASSSQPEVAALDLTFSAPKSVSVLFAVACREVSEGLVECHEEAVRAALGFLEDEAMFVRRGRAVRRYAVRAHGRVREFAAAAEQGARLRTVRDVADRFHPAVLERKSCFQTTSTFAV